jgi:PPOX class probable F420-dependent enzyme
MQPSDPFGEFSGRRYINPESYKKNGEPKLTPVQAIGDNGIVYLRTGANSWKVKRIRRNPHVRIVPSDRRGNPTGSWVDGEAHMLEGDEYVRTMELFRKEYGTFGNAMVKLVASLRGEDLTVIVSIRPWRSDSA